MLMIYEKSPVNEGSTGKIICKWSDYPLAWFMGTCRSETRFSLPQIIGRFHPVLAFNQFWYVNDRTCPFLAADPHWERLASQWRYQTIPAAGSETWHATSMANSFHSVNTVLQHLTKTEFIQPLRPSSKKECWVGTCWDTTPPSLPTLFTPGV